MREFLNYLIPNFRVRWEIARQHALPAISIVTVVISFYYAYKMVPAGWVSYIISTFFLFLIGLTALARLNDIPHSYTHMRWQIRRGGLMMVGVSCLWLGVAPIMQAWSGAHVDFPSWYEVMLRCGMFFVWMTTPMMPPWHRYISGEYRRLVVEVPEGVQVDVKRGETTPDGGMYVERRKASPHWEDGP